MEETFHFDLEWGLEKPVPFRRPMSAYSPIRQNPTHEEAERLAKLER